MIFFIKLATIQLAESAATQCGGVPLANGGRGHGGARLGSVRLDFHNFSEGEDSFDFPSSIHLYPPYLHQKNTHLLRGPHIARRRFLKLPGILVKLA